MTVNRTIIDKISPNLLLRLKGIISNNNDLITSWRQGFTLIELLIVLALMGVLTGLSALGIKNWRASQNLKTASADLITNLKFIQSNTTSVLIYNCDKVTGNSPGTYRFAGYRVQKRSPSEPVTWAYKAEPLCQAVTSNIYWGAGSDFGFNSDPASIKYFYTPADISLFDLSLCLLSPSGQFLNYVTSNFSCNQIISPPLEVGIAGNVGTDLKKRVICINPQGSIYDKGQAYDWSAFVTC